jgi:transposase
MVTVEKPEPKVSEKKRKVFSGEFKAKVALEAIRGVSTVNRVSRARELHPRPLVGRVEDWRADFRKISM